MPPLWKCTDVAVMEGEGGGRGLSGLTRGPAGREDPSATVGPFLVQTLHLLESSNSPLIWGRQAPPRCFILGAPSQ